MKKSNYIRLLGLIIVLLLLIALGVLKDIQSYFNYMLLVALFMQGVKSIIDYILEFPMKVGFSKVLEKNDENEIGRFILLCLGIAMIVVSAWWFFNKSI